MDDIDVSRIAFDAACELAESQQAELTRLRAEVESEKATSKILLDSYADENQRISDERDALKLRLAVLEAGAEAPTCPVCGSDCNERDELMKAEREVEALKLQRAAADIVGRETANIVLLQVGEIESLRDALHQISLCSQNSSSNKEECGRIARRALEKK